MDPSAPFFPVPSSCSPAPQESDRAFLTASATATRKRPAPDGTDTAGGGAGKNKHKQARITLGSIGDYETQEAIGAGSFGVVVKARHRGTGEAVAIKCARKAAAPPNSSSNNLRRILREAGCMAACRGHPSVVGIRDVVVDAATGTAFLVMELVAGGSLLRLQRTRSPARFSEGETRAFMRQLLRGAERMHGAGIIHRDIKPGNILVSAGTGALKICDLGLATPTPARPAEGTAAYPERRVGTLLYRSPEQLAGRRDYGPGVDVWALGCVMAELLTGRLMFDEETEDGMVARVTELGRALADRRLQAFYDWPTFHGGPHLSRGAREVLAGLLAVQPRDRLTAAAALQHPWFAEEEEKEKEEEELLVATCRSAGRAARSSTASVVTVVV
jgi:cell division cycle 2-like protein